MVSLLAMLVLAGGERPPQKLKMSGWVVFWNDRSPESFAANVKKINEVMPEWIKVTSDGRAVRRAKPDPVNLAFLATAKKNKVAVYGMTSNYSDDFDGNLVHRFLVDPVKRDQHISQLTAIAVEDKLAGIDLDYESLAAADRDLYSDFVERLGTALRKVKKKLSVTVHAKESEPGNWDGAIAQDWARLGKAADVFRVMTYDQHWSTSEAGPIAGDDWVERVLRFAVSKVPATKVDMGVAAYGYDWSKKPATSLVWQDFTKAGSAKIDPVSGELVADQTWFSGDEAFKRKKALAEKLGVRGLSLWYIGSEQPTIWSRL